MSVNSGAKSNLDDDKDANDGLINPQRKAPLIGHVWRCEWINKMNTKRKEIHFQGKIIKNLEETRVMKKLRF